MNNLILFLSDCPSIIKRLFQTLSSDTQSTHLFKVTHGGLNPARFAFRGHEMFLMSNSDSAFNWYYV